MAELADAGGLNPPEGNFLRVRFPLRAPTRQDFFGVNPLALLHELRDNSL